MAAEAPSGLRILLHQHGKERGPVSVSSHADRDRVIVSELELFPCPPSLDSRAVAMPFEIDVKPRFAISTCTARYWRYIPVHQVAGTWTARYPTVPPKIDRQQYRSIGGEIDRWWSIDGEKRKKKKRKRRKKEKRSTYFPTRVANARAPLPIVGRGRFFSRMRRRNVSPRGEKGRGDVSPFIFY
ncbi:hypothetical protein BHM03_00036414 [Ensete ventricosum]|nr:hypothetical protein BHM03_00036414 [Ensete ventricosum]